MCEICGYKGKRTSLLKLPPTFWDWLTSDVWFSFIFPRASLCRIPAGEEACTNQGSHQVSSLTAWKY